MKVFISWSGAESKQIARCLYDWLPIVLQSVEPYMSAEEIEKGTRWSTDIAKELEATNFGILCLTPTNVDAPWIHFEAGALAKVIDHARVAPFLFGLKPSDIRGPLAQFQLTNFDQDEVKRLLKSINSVTESEALDDNRLEKAFAALWGELHANISKISFAHPQIQ